MKQIILCAALHAFLVSCNTNNSAPASSTQVIHDTIYISDTPKKSRGLTYEDLKKGMQNTFLTTKEEFTYITNLNGLAADINNSGEAKKGYSLNNLRIDGLAKHDKEITRSIDLYFLMRHEENKQRPCAIVAGFIETSSKKQFFKCIPIGVDENLIKLCENDFKALSPEWNPVLTNLFLHLAQDYAEFKK